MDLGSTARFLCKGLDQNLSAVGFFYEARDEAEFLLACAGPFQGHTGKEARDDDG